MEKSYKVVVDCANCARLMNDEIKKIDGVKDSEINFIMGKINIKFDDGVDEKKVISAVRKKVKEMDDEFDILV